MDINDERSTALISAWAGKTLHSKHKEKNYILLVFYQYKCLFAALSTKNGCSARLPFKTISVFMWRGQTSFSERWQARPKYNTSFVIRKNLALCSSYRIIVNVVIVSGSDGFGYCLPLAGGGAFSFGGLIPFKNALSYQHKHKLIEPEHNVLLGFHQTEKKLHTCCKWKRLWVRAYGRYEKDWACFMDKLHVVC